jgi:multicomponent Na+:H+ antiporter subunit G
VIGEVLALVGAFLILVSATGVARFADVLNRLHALAKASTLGIVLIFTGAAINLRDLNDITSVVLAGVLHLLASPPASNMISRAAYLAGDVRGEVVDEHPTAATHLRETTDNRPVEGSAGPPPAR